MFESNNCRRGCYYVASFEEHLLVTRVGNQGTVSRIMRAKCTLVSFMGAILSLILTAKQMLILMYTYQFHSVISIHPYRGRDQYGRHGFGCTTFDGNPNFVGVAKDDVVLAWRPRQCTSAIIEE